MVEIVFKLPLLVDFRLQNKDIDYLIRRISYIKKFAVKKCMPRKYNLQAEEEISSLRKKLSKIKILKDPEIITVRGTFFPGLLLTSGWWERDQETKAPKHVWKNSLQEWLFRGFEQWGPSWDFSPLPMNEENAGLFGQLGTGDEVNSIPVIVFGEKAKNIRLNLLGDCHVFEAKVTGLLCHRTHLEEMHLPVPEQWGRAFDYCLVLYADEKRHSLLRCSEKTESYSGYLWECWGPKDLSGKKNSWSLDDVYFIWEHTELSRPDTIEYSLDGLEKKAFYIKQINPDLVILQKSSPIIKEKTLWPTKLFYEFILSQIDQKV